MAVSNITLTAIQEMAPGQVSSIRNSVMDAVVAKASSELSLPENKLLVRDIRPYSDLAWGTNAAFWASTHTLTVDVWGTIESGTAAIADGTGGAYRETITSGTTMGDNRYIALYGVRDMRVSLPAIVAQDISLIKFEVGAADRTIWDLTKCEAYTNAIAGITTAAIVIPPLSPYQISCYLMTGGVNAYIQLIGFVVEPVGLLLTP